MVGSDHLVDEMEMARTCTATMGGKEVLLNVLTSVELTCGADCGAALDHIDRRVNCAPLQCI